MRRLFWALVVWSMGVVGVCGCNDKTAPTQPEDPRIKAERKVQYPGGHVETPVGGGGYNHGAKSQKYEGPYSKAPGWAKD